MARSAIDAGEAVKPLEEQRQSDNRIWIKFSLRLIIVMVKPSLHDCKSLYSEPTWGGGGKPSAQDVRQVRPCDHNTQSSCVGHQDPRPIQWFLHINYHPNTRQDGLAFPNYV